MSPKLAIFVCLFVLQGVLYVSCRECLSPGDCDPGYCCVLGMHRHAVPHCLPMRKEGESCRVGNTPQDKQYFSSYGEIKEATVVYSTLCPCVSGFECKRGKCIKI